MRLFVVKAKTLFIGILAVLMVCVCIGASGGIRSVFKVGNREITIEI